MKFDQKQHDWEYIGGGFAPTKPNLIVQTYNAFEVFVQNFITDTIDSFKPFQSKKADLDSNKSNITKSAEQIRKEEQRVLEMAMIQQRIIQERHCHH